MDSLSTLQDWFSSVCGEGFDLGSSCTERFLVDLVNLVFLVLYLVSLLTACLRRQPSEGNRPRRWDFIVVSVCSALAGIAYFIAGAWVLSNEAHSFVRWEPIGYFVRGLIWLAIAASLTIRPTKGTETASLLWWSSFFVLISVYDLKVLLTHQHKLQMLDFLSWPINLLLLYCSFRIVTQRFYDQKRSKTGLSEPLLSATSKSGESNRPGIFSLLTFSWLNPLMRLGYSKPLELVDIPPLNSEDKAFQAYQHFSEAWEHELQEKGRKSNLVVLALFKCFLNEVLLTGFYALLKTLSLCLAPLLLYAFVQYSNVQEKDLQTGVLLIVSLVVLKLAESLSQRHCFFYSRRLGMRMRSSLMAAVFNKQLKLSSLGRKKNSTGEIVNYIAVDAYRLGEFPYWFHMAWSLPLQLLFSVVILFWALSFGAIPGLVPLTIFGFLNLPFAKALQGYQSKFMVAQDERLRATSEALNNMKIIKLQSWEDHFRSIIENLRNAEFKWLSEIQYKKAYGSALYWMSPTFISAVIFAGTAALKSAPLNASTIFTVLSALRIMSEPVRLLPEVLTMMIQVKVSLDRIGAFLLEDEINEDNVKRGPAQNSDISIKIHNGNFSWEPDEPIPTLKNVNLNINRGQKIAICGTVGSGKSSLLYAILGEIPKLTGSVEVLGSIAYVAQTAWIQSGTIRDNILFGKPMDKELYRKAIECCALDKDIENFDHKDLTEIGQRGLNMSGGQKQRIQLARAVYNDADTYILDDPFSAVDAHTAAILFHNCVMAALEKKTVILVTHQVEFLTEADRILVMENGRVAEEGSYAELLKFGAVFRRLVDAHKSSLKKLDSLSNESQVQTKSISATYAEPMTMQFIKQNSEEEISARVTSVVQLTEDEEKEIGELGWKPYKSYFHVSKGYFNIFMVSLCQAAFVILQTAATYWLAVVVQIHQVKSGILVGVYAAVSMSSCLFSYFRSLAAAILGLRASKAFFSSFMDSVFKAPMLFFDSTPVGRILTRASSDLSILDFDIPYSICFVLSGSVELTTIVIIMATVTWQALVVAIPVMIMMVFVQRYYVATARELVRINGTTKAPVMNYAAESFLGAATIRAFTVIHRFIKTNYDLIDNDAKTFYYTIGVLEWVLLRVEALQNLTVFTSSVFLILLPQGAISPGFSGLCLTYALNLSSCQVFLTRYYANLENYIISVERIKQFMNIPSEPPAIIIENRPPAAWPNEGRIDLHDLKVKYRPSAPFVLKGINCTFEAGSKVGVVGRTGSGKTTLISALFRLVDPAEGRILIDDLDICTIGLKDLRMKLSIIPQEPTLFRGSVRTNLDPLGHHTDQEIWEALEKCQLKTVISSLPALLDSSVGDDGQNWSAGQRQLFCLGRVLLRKNRILVLDEATASIDSATDAVLQRVIKNEFKSCTVITVAHRISTVTDSDMVLVLSYGKLLEYNKPSKLLENSSSAFSKLVADYWSNCKRDSEKVGTAD